MSFDELLADVGAKLTQMQQWQRELSGLRKTAASESGAVAAEVDQFGLPSRLWLDESALRLRPAELGRQIVAVFGEAAEAVDVRRAEITRQLAAETTSWSSAAITTDSAKTR